MLPSSSCSIAMPRMFCAPLECWVQPSAYIDVIVFVGEDVSPIISQIVRNRSFGVPQRFSTNSGVYTSTCWRSRFHTQRGSSSDGSVMT